jgi:hypothetical protein
MSLFGGANKIKIDKVLLERVKHIAQVAGYASHEEFVQHVLEREVAQFEGAKSDAEITEKLRGLGYIS